MARVLGEEGSEMKCPVCNESTIVEVKLMLDSSLVVMQSCSGCDSRRWIKDGNEVAVEGILQAASRR